MKIFSRRKAFTLVELFIGILVLGILASAMSFSSTETVSTARAAKIVADLNSLKRATLEWYADNREFVKTLQRKQYDTSKNVRIQTVNKDDALGIGKYLSGQKLTINDYDNDERLRPGSYAVYNVYGHRTTWYVGYCFKNESEAVKRKLIDNAKSTGLIFAQHWPDPLHDDYNPKARVKELTGYETVWLHVLGNHESTFDWWDSDKDEQQPY